MTWLFPWLMFAHVFGAIWAFGPAFAFGTYGRLAAEERGPALAFNNRARAMVSRRMVTPGTIVVLASGFLMIWVTNLPWANPAFRWLQVAIVIYLAMIAWNLLVTTPRSRRIGELGAQAAARAREAAERAAETGQAPSPPASAGPPPEMARLIHQVRRDGKVMGVVIVIMVFLMVVKPSFPL